MCIDEKYLNHKLCYVDSEEWPGSPMTLYFTEFDDISKQWGDDWNDRPYEHNAGTPYEYDYSQPEQGVKNGVGIYPKISIFKMVIMGAYNILTPRTNTRNSPYSVEDINKGIVPWLTITNNKDNTIFVKAGITVKDLLDILKSYEDYIDIYVQYKINDETTNMEMN